MHRVTTSKKVKGEYKYISVFVFRLFGGHHRVCLHTSGHTGQGGCLLVRTRHAQGKWQETEEECRCKTADRWEGQQDDEGG